MVNVVNTKATPVSNLDATPIVHNDAYFGGAPLKEKVATLEVGGTETAGSVFRFVRVRSSCRVSSVEWAADAMTGFTAADIGVYDTKDNGGAVVTDNLWANNVNISAGAAFTDATYNTTATNIAVVTQRLWELLGLAADPYKDYDICITADTIGSAAGTLSLRVRYVD